MPSNAEKLIIAIRGKMQVSCIYDGYLREMCPHAIGWKRGAHHVLSYQFGGQSSQGLPPGGQWKCMDVDRIASLAVKDGAWFTGLSHLRPQNCIDTVEAEVAH